jgi:hypothetical protein
MSNRINHRRTRQRKRSENANVFSGGAWGGKRQAAKGRKRYKAIRNRSARRTGCQTPGIGMYRKPYVLPDLDEGEEECPSPTKQP